MLTSDQQTVNTTTTEIKELLDHFAEAQRLSDLDPLSELLTDDFKLVGPVGLVVPGDQRIDELIEALEWDDVDICTHAWKGDSE